MNVLFLLSLANFQLCFGSLPLKTISNYFLFRQTRVVNGFLCNEKDSKDFLKFNLGNNIISSSFYTPINSDDFKIVFGSKSFRTGSFFDLRCELTQNIFHKVSEERMLNMTNVILLYGEEKSFSAIDKTRIAFDSDVALMTNNEIYDLYKIYSYLDLKRERIGYWNGSYEKIMRKKSRFDLEGNSIKGSVVIVHIENYGTGPKQEEMLIDYNFQRESDLLTRFALVQVKNLESIYNYKNDYVVTNTWGYYNKTIGGWKPNSMFGQIQNDEVDLGISASKLASKRMNVAWFPPGIFKFRGCFIFKHPSTLADYNAFAKPFTIGSWAAVFVFIFVSAMVLNLVRNTDVIDVPPNDKSISDSILIVIGTVCQQGAISSLRLPNRVIFLFLEIASLLIYAHYGASVLGFLLTPSPITINTIDKLIESPFQMYAEKMPYQLDHFTSNLSVKASKAYEKRIKGPTPEQDKFIQLEVGVKKMQEGGFAFYAQDSNLYNQIDKTFDSAEKCALTEIETLFHYASIPVKKKSHFRELMYSGMVVLRERGILRRDFLKWYAPRPSCFGKEESSPVRLEATYVALIIYTVGFLFSIAFLIYEIIEKRVEYKEKLLKF